MELKWQDYVVEAPDFMLGRPTFKGTQLTIEHGQAVLRYAAAVMTMDEVIYR